jgi:hypothetical protein
LPAEQPNHRRAAETGGEIPVADEGDSCGGMVIGQGRAAVSEEGAEEFHFLGGGERCKYQWRAVPRPNRRRHWNRR